MASSGRISCRQETWAERHPITAYFVLTFVVSWTCALAVAAPHLLSRTSLTQLTGVLMFPAMLLGPSLAGILLTGIIDGKTGLRGLLARMVRIRLSARWYAALLIPPALVLTVLFCLKTFVSPIYTPTFFPLGLLFGVPAGLLEEIGWTGFAFHRMSSPQNALVPAILLGVLWSLWHLPVINYLGVATPHPSWWLPFFLVFFVAMTAMRVLISWLYTNTTSILLTQLLHISSTGSLVVFSAARVNAAEEVLWYGIYESRCGSSSALW